MMDNNGFKFGEFASGNNNGELNKTASGTQEEFDLNGFSKTAADNNYDINAFSEYDISLEDTEFEQNKGSIEFFDGLSKEPDVDGNLDDRNLSDDFVIGKDFFIDSTEADGMVIPTEPKTVPNKKKAKKQSTGKSCLLAVVWMVLILVISVSAALGIMHFGMDYLGVGLDDDATVEIEVVIEEGAGTKEIAQTLKEAGIIDSPLFFRFYARQSGQDKKFKHGIYYFTKQDSYEDIAETLAKKGAIAASVKVTIPEGLNVDEIAEILEENKICTVAQFKEAVNEATFSKYNVSFMDELKTQADGVHYILEGFLFPDTYELYATNDKTGAEQAIKKMLQNMDKKFTPEMYERAKEMGYSMNEVLTIASMVEMEASVADYPDKQKVSAVFQNRLKSKDYPKLQSNPTSDYPYNTDRYDTYKISGLAPGAYCSPSLDSINAALYPDEKCKAYYFVTDKDMNFYFNNTLTEHSNTILNLKRKGLWA